MFVRTILKSHANLWIASGGLVNQMIFFIFSLPTSFFTTNGCLLLLRSKLEGVCAGRNNDKKWIDAFARACLCKRFLPLALWYCIKQRLRKIWSGSCVTFRWLEEEEGYPVVGQGKLHRMGKLMLVENTLRTNSCVKIVFASIQVLNSQPHATGTGYYCAKWWVLCRIWPTTWSGWSSPTWRWPFWRLTISSKSGETFSRPFGRTRSDRRAQRLTQTSWQNPCRWRKPHLVYFEIFKGFTPEAIQGFFVSYWRKYFSRSKSNRPRNHLILYFFNP